MSTRASIREVERETIAKFLQHMSRDFAAANVLDYGCGTQPYRKLIEEAGGNYTGYDRFGHPGSTVHTDVGDDDPLSRHGRWDVIVCTQVIQYWLDPEAELRSILFALRSHGTLLLTGPVNWEEVENTDLRRFTQSGIRTLLEDVGFKEVSVYSRHGIEVNDVKLSLGWAASARG